jgi:hypothetical protein
MDFIIGFPLKVRRDDSILIVVETLMKNTHFIHVRTMYQAPNIARFFISNIVRLHGMPKRIMSDQGSVFTGSFWTSFPRGLGNPT